MSKTPEIRTYLVGISPPKLLRDLAHTVFIFGQHEHHPIVALSPLNLKAEPCSFVERSRGGSDSDSVRDACRQGRSCCSAPRLAGHPQGAFHCKHAVHTSHLVYIRGIISAWTECVPLLILAVVPGVYLVPDTHDSAAQTMYSYDID